MCVLEGMIINILGRDGSYQKNWCPSIVCTAFGSEAIVAWLEFQVKGDMVYSKELRAPLET